MYNATKFATSLEWKSVISGNFRVRSNVLKERKYCDLKQLFPSTENSCTEVTT